MAHVLNDRVQEATNTTGTGTLQLSGAVAGYQTFVAGIGNGNTTDYCIEDPNTGDWEVGRGTVTDGSPDTLSRTTVLSSSNAGGPISFAAGTKYVFCTLASSSLLGLPTLGDPGADRLLFWDDSAGKLAWMQVGVDGFVISDTTLTLDDLLGLQYLGDPNADRIYFFDDSDNQAGWLTVGTGLAITGTTLASTITQYTDEMAQDAVGAMVGSSLAYTDATPLLDTIQDIRTSASPQFAGINVGHASDTTITRLLPGVIAVEGAQVYTSNGLDVSLADGGTGASLTDPNADRIFFWDDSAGATTWLVANTGLAISGTNLNCTITQYTDALAVAAIKADAAWHAANWDTAYGWGNHASAGYLTSVTAHNLLSTTHGDTTAAAVVRGDLVTGQGASPTWSRLAVGAAGTYLAGGTEPAWATLNQAAVAGLTTASTPTFAGLTIAASGAAAGYANIYSQYTNSGTGETHTSRFSTHDNNVSIVRALFSCAGPLNAGDDNQGYFDFTVEDGSLYIGRFKSLAADNGATLSLYDRAGPQVIKTHLHAAGVSYFTGGALVVGATSASDSADFYVSGKISASGEVEINGALNHDGSTAGFFGVAPATRPTAYTQTYSTASKTVPNATASNPPAGGTGATAGAYDTAANRNAMITSLTNVIADVDALRKVVTAIIDDLQALGLLQ